MESKRRSQRELLEENEQLHIQLEEAQETLRAIQNGEVDAMVVSGPEGEQIFTLKGADHTYRMIVEDMSDGAATLTSDGAILYCNARLANMLETPLEEVMGASVFRFLTSSDRSTLEGLLRQATKGRAEVELSLTTGEGNKLPVHISVSSLQLEEQQCLCLVATDLTQQVRFQEIVAEERLSKSIIEQATESIIVCDKDGKIIRCSEEAKEICRENPLLQEFNAVFPLQLGRAEPQSSTPELFSVRDCIHGKEFKNITCSYMGKGDRQLSLLLSAGPVSVERGETLGCTVTLTDVTSLVEAQQRMQRLNLLLRSVRNINQLITREKDVGSLLKGACDNLVENRSCFHSWVITLDEAAKIITYSETGVGENFSSLIRQAKKGNLPICCQEAMEQDEVVAITVDPQATCAGCVLSHQCMGEVVLTAKIRYGDRLYGFMSASMPKAVLSDTEELMLFREVAGDISFALHDLELEQLRRKSEEALALEKEHLEVTLHSTGDGIIATDIQGNITIVNRVAESLTGWTQVEAKGKPTKQVFNVVDERNHRPIANPIENVLKTGRVVGLVNHAMLISRDGTERIIADSGAPIRDERGNIVGVVLVFRDITDLRKLEEEQMKVEKLESVGTLAGGIAHDFNNLLTGILGNITLAKRHVETGGKAFERLDEAEKASLRARDLTQQLLTFSRGGSPVKQVMHLGVLIRESVTFCLRGSSVKPEFSLPDDIWAVEADEGQINQVILNIVKNADEAMPAGGKLHISASNTIMKRLRTIPLPGGNYLRIEIRDEGIGMSRKQLERIFEPYYTTKQKGSGLGLSTAYSIIKNHGGYITAESRQNVGTTFHIYLPASEEPAPKMEEVKEGKHLTGKGNVLVMDDEEIIRDMLSKMLPVSGYQVELTRDGAEAIAKYIEARNSGRPFDAVIMDLTIPGGMGGKEAVKKLLEVDPDAKVIVSSGYSTDPIMSEYKEYGFSAVITKPYSVSQMEKTLRGMLKGKK